MKKIYKLHTPSVVDGYDRADGSPYHTIESTDYYECLDDLVKEIKDSDSYSFEIEIVLVNEKEQPDE